MSIVQMLAAAFAIIFIAGFTGSFLGCMYAHRKSKNTPTDKNWKWN